jgi:Helicase associated domain
MMASSGSDPLIPTATAVTPVPSVATPVATPSRKIPSPPPPGKSASNRRSWDENYAQLLIYKAMHGNCEVPYGYKADPVLGKWVSHLRENQDQKLMSEERKAALNAIGFNWNPQENRWNEQFEKLREYQRQFGSTKIPTNYKDRTLSKWVKRQRENCSSGILQDHRKMKLDAIGFVWKVKEPAPKSKTKRNNKVNEEQWKKQYDKLVEFKTENGHCNCPKTYDKDPSLGKWVSKQRLQNNRGQLTKERKKLLEDLGFVFSFQAKKKQQEWNHMYEMLKACQDKDSTEFIVPKEGPDASSVARWVQRQREKYRNSKMDPGREVLLRKINFPFPQVDDPTDIHSDAPSSDASKEADEVVAVVVDAMQREDVALQTAAEEDQAGKKIGHCIDVLAQYLSTTPAELAARLPLSSKRPLVGDAKEEATTVFGRLMPKIVALRDVAIKYSDNSCLREAQNFLEEVLQREKAEPRPLFAGHGGRYSRLLSLAVELGVVLEPTGRCHAVLRSCEMYLDHLLSQKDDGSHSLAAFSMTEVSVPDEDSVENVPPASKRQKLCH